MVTSYYVGGLTPTIKALALFVKHFLLNEPSFSLQSITGRLAALLFQHDIFYLGK